MSERIPIGSDHAGYEMKEALIEELHRRGLEVEDLGADSEIASDYPDFAHPVASRVEAGEVNRAILLCGTGLGMGYAANRHARVRAAVVWSPEVAHLSRQHNDCNILVLPARMVDLDTAKAILGEWLDTPFDGGRHERRIEKIEVPE